MADTENTAQKSVASFTDTRGQTFNEDIPETSRALFQKALNGTCSPRQAIKAFCLRCVGYSRADVTNCTAWKCPLHRYRPFQDRPEVDDA